MTTDVGTTVEYRGSEGFAQHGELFTIDRLTDDCVTLSSNDHERMVCVETDQFHEMVENDEWE